MLSRFYFFNFALSLFGVMHAFTPKPESHSNRKMPPDDSRDLLLGLIIIDVSYNLFYLFLTVAARGISQKFAHINMISLTCIFIYIIYFGATGKQQFIVTNSINQNLFDSWYCTSVNLCQRRLAYQLANNDSISTCQITVAVGS